MTELFTLELILLAACCVALGWHLRNAAPSRPGTQCPNRTDLEKMEKHIMAKLSELAGTLNALADQTDKIKTEVAALKDALTNVDLPADAQAALDRLTTAVQTVDELNPDPDAPPAT